MKKKYRSIIVNDKKFTWAITNYNCDGDGSIKLHIWFNKKEIFSEYISGCVQITPKYVKNIIELKKL